MRVVSHGQRLGAVFIALIYLCLSIVATLPSRKVYAAPEYPGTMFFKENDDQCGNEQGAQTASKPGPVYFLGDSIGTQIENPLSSAFSSEGWSFKGNSVSGRTIGQGLTAVDGDQDFIRTAGHLVIELGTNSAGFSAATIGQMVDKLRAINVNAQLYWVDTATVQRPELAPVLSGVNRTIHEQSLAKGYRVISWNKAVFGPNADPTNINPNAPDNGYIRRADQFVHLENAGVNALSDLITTNVKSINGAEGNPGNLDSPVPGAAGSVTDSGYPLVVKRDATGNFIDDNLTGGSNEEKIFNYFVGTAKLQPYQAAGIMGNMYAESRFNPRALQPGKTGDAPIEGRGYGLVQWTYAERQQPLVNRAKQYNVPVYSLAFQLDHVMWELKVKFKGFDATLRATKTVEEATRFIEDKYEIHAGGPQPTRITKAQEMLTRFGGNNPGQQTGDASASCTSSAAQSGADNLQVNGSLSLPLEAKWYAENKQWFTKPHHDYPAADIPVPKGTPVYSMSNGKIIKAPTGGACGTGVQVDLGGGVTITYCHGSDGGAVPGAKEGDTVKPGQLIMHSDTTGHSTGPHLHVGIRVSGKSVCPQSLLVAIAENQPLPKFESLPAAGCTN